VDQVFISYARADGGDYASSIIRQLQKNDFKHWIDSDKIGIGDEWLERIDDALRTSFALILIITPEALKSKHVTYEWIFALGRGIKVFPLLFQSIVESDLHPKLARLNYENCLDPKSRPWNKIIDNLTTARAEYSPILANRLLANAPRFVQNALDNVESPSEHIRRDAIDQLAKSDHPAAIEAIAQLIHQHHLPDVRINAAFAFAEKSQYQDERAIEGLLEALQDSSDDKRKRASRILTNYGELSIPGLIVSLGNQFSETRYVAARTLGEIKAKTALTDLLLLIKDEHDKVVHAALDAIEQIGSASIAKTLVANLNHQNDNVQIHICKVLFSLGEGHTAKSTLLKLMKCGEINYVARPAAELLILLGQEVIPNVIDALEDQSTSTLGRSVAIELLAELKAENAIPHLIKALKDKAGYVRGRAAYALGNMRVSEAVNDIELLLYDADSNARSDALWALEIIGTSEAKEAIEKWVLSKRDD
jgi:HEAT repeat protein